MPDRKSDGLFLGENDPVWIISEEEKGFFIGLEKGRAEAEQKREEEETKSIEQERKRAEAMKSRDTYGIDWTTTEKTITDEGGKTSEYHHKITIDGETIELIERNVFDFGRVINRGNGDGYAVTRGVWRGKETVLMTDKEDYAYNLVKKYGKFAKSNIRM